MFIVFGSKRISNVSIPLRRVGEQVIEVPCTGNIMGRLKGIWSFLNMCVKNPDAVIIADTPHWTGLVVLVLTTILRREYVLRLRGLILQEHPSPLLRSMNRRILRRARGVIFISRFMQDSMAAELPGLQSYTIIPVPHMDVERTAAPPGSIPPGDGSTCILTVTGFHFSEKIKPLLDIFPVVDQVLDLHPATRWVICGGGPLLGDALSRRARCKNSDRIIIKGFCHDIIPEYRQATVFLYFTGLDSFGCVINEAFLMGLPVVANTEASMPEMVENRTDGWLIDTSDRLWQEELRRVLEAAVDHPEVTTRMGKAGRQKVLGSLSPERIGRLYTSFFSELRLTDCSEGSQSNG